MATDKNRIQTFARDDLYEWLLARASRENRSLSNLIETILEQFKRDSEAGDRTLK